MKHSFLFTTLFALLLSLSACGGSGGVPSEADPVTVLQALEAAFDARDPDAAAALYAEDGYETNGRGTFSGREEIREFYAEMMLRVTMDCKDYVANGNTVTYVCVMNRAGLLTGERYEAIVENGKITSNVRTNYFTP
ncbi:MAG: nuclear transport factor 2 family protein [Anaerolineales bacterium]|nr:nuclear transport factor 2 family protein [Anaerolineales bacterium]